MRKQDVRFDYRRYRQLLAEAVDENKRLALIDVLIEERARERQKYEDETYNPLWSTVPGSERPTGAPPPVESA